MDGEPVFKFGDSGPEGWIIVCIFYVDKFIVTDLEINCVKVFDERGQFSYKFGEKGNGNGQLNQPYGLCVDKHDNVFLLPKCSVIGFWSQISKGKKFTF